MAILAAIGASAEMIVRSAAAREAVSQQDVVTWTVTIPEGFPRNVYTWRLKADGTYEEDGRDLRTGIPVQRTLTGRWTVEGERMFLRQDRINYLFDGVIVGDRYFGTLYLNIRKVSPFCAVKGETVPQNCDAPKVASQSTHRGISTQ
jgi:hypothetical protein